MVLLFVVVLAVIVGVAVVVFLFGSYDVAELPLFNVFRSLLQPQ